MGDSISVILVAAAFALCVVWMVVAWHRRQTRDATLLPAPVAPGEQGEEIVAVADLRYVATTVQGEPLDRLAIGPLAYPGRADILVRRHGVAIRIVGAPEVFLGSDRLVAAGKATWAVGRVVEKGGLLALTWRCADETTIADTYVRALEPGDDERILAAVTGLLPAAAGAGQTGPQQGDQ